jgi:signal transduction histidine kinase
MGARTLEARLTGRLLALAGTVLVAVGLAAVLVNDRVLDRGDSDAARAHAVGAVEAVARERSEGDSPEEALREVIASADAEGARLSIHHAGLTAGHTTLPPIEPGICATLDDTGEAPTNPVGARGAGPWRACAAGSEGETLVVAAVPIGANRAAVRTLARGMAAVVLVGLLTMWMAVRRTIRGPLAELEAVVRWTSRVADVEPPAPPPAARTREIVQLESAFDDLVHRLLESLARERASSAHMAHELRTPLTSIVAELEGLRAREPSSVEVVERVLADVARFADVIEAIVVLSSGPQRAVRTDAVVNLADLAREMAPEGSVVEAPDEALVEVDERLVRLALRNLVDNARKYASGARVVKVSRRRDTAYLAVLDEGPGLDGAARARMFERYWRGSADGGGRGLGLALVRAVAERHGGRVEARPGPGGTGLEVSMTFERLVGWHEVAPEPA